MDVKRCRKCGETKPVEMFSGNGREKDGLHKRCRTCLGAIYEAQRQKARTNWHFAKNAISTYEKREAYIGLSSDTDQETQQATDEIQHEVVLPNIELLRLPTRTALLYAHRKEYREIARQYKQARDEEKRLAKRVAKLAYREASRQAREIWEVARHEAREAARQANRQARELEWEFYRDLKPISKSSTREEIRVYRRATYLLRQARIKANGGTHTRAEIRALREAQNHQCAYCKREVKLTEDHIIPLPQGGRNDIANICMACRRCNTQKNARTPEQWVKRWYQVEQGDQEAS